MKRRTLIIISIFVFSIVLIAFQLRANKQTMKADVAFAQKTTTTIPVKVVTAMHSNLNEEITEHGKLLAEKTVPVHAEFSGKIDKLFVDQGDFIKKGEPIAQINNEVLVKLVETAKTNLLKAKKDLERMTVLVENNVRTKADLEYAELNHVNAEAELDRIMKQWDNSTVKAPNSGVIYKLYAEQGQLISAAHPLVKIASLNNFKLPIYVDEKTSVLINTGEKVEIKVLVDNDLKLTGTVKSISKVAEDNGNYLVDIRLPNSAPNTLRAGMTVKVYFPIDESQALLIPRSAIIGSLKSPKVFVVNNNKVEERSLKIGSTNGIEVEVISGLNNNEQVVVSGQINLENGSLVRVL